MDTGECPLWVKSGYFTKSDQCPLYPKKQTLIERVAMSALCQKRTLLASFDHLVGAGKKCRWYDEAERLGRLKIDRQLILVRRLHRQIGRLVAF